MFNTRKKRIAELEAQLKNEKSATTTAITLSKREKNALDAEIINKDSAIRGLKEEIITLKTENSLLKQDEVVGEPAKVIASLKREVARLTAYKKRIEEKAPKKAVKAKK